MTPKLGKPESMPSRCPKAHSTGLDAIAQTFELAKAGVPMPLLLSSGPQSHSMDASRNTCSARQRVYEGEKSPRPRKMAWPLVQIPPVFLMRFEPLCHLCTLHRRRRTQANSRFPQIFLQQESESYAPPFCHDLQDCMSHPMTDCRPDLRSLFLPDCHSETISPLEPHRNHVGETIGAVWLPLAEHLVA